MPIQSGNPNRIELANGSYMLFDYLDGKYRIAIYTRKVSKSETLEAALSRALQLPAYNKKVKEISTYIHNVGRFEAMTLE